MSDAESCVGCSASLETSEVDQHLPPGTSLRSGQLSIVKALGQGGFGITYLGNDVQLRRQVAIKEFFPSDCVRRELSVRPVTGHDFTTSRTEFLDEARALAQFSHPGIVHVYSFFEENNTAYMVMEYLKGNTLAQLVEKDGPLSEEAAVDYIVRIGEALQVVHDAHMLHRDIKPENIIVTDDGRVVMIDFGIAREFIPEATQQTHSTMITPGYAPLEQYASKARRGAGTDIYALGGTFYFLLVSHPPPASIDRFVSETPLVPVVDVRPEISRSVSDAIMWAMELSIDNRPPSMTEFLRILKAGAPPPAPVKSTTLRTMEPYIPARGAQTPLQFSSGRATSVRELAELCDKDPQEALDYLSNGYFEKWLALNLGEAALARRASQLAANRAEPRQQLELFVRDLYRAGEGDEADPRLVADRPVVDLGRVPIGTAVSQTFRLENQGRGHAWGTAELEGLPSNVKVTASFTECPATLTVSTDGTAIPVGRHQGHVVVKPEGLAPLRLEVVLESVPVRVEIVPERLDLGSLMFGQKVATSITVRCDPPEARLNGLISVNASEREVNVAKSFSGSEAEIKLQVATHRLEAGQRYERLLQLSTNHGNFTVPITFETVANQGIITRWTVALAVMMAALFGLGRAVLSSSHVEFSRWFVSASHTPAVMQMALWFGLAAMLCTFILLKVIDKPVGSRGSGKTATQPTRHVQWS